MQKKRKYERPGIVQIKMDFEGRVLAGSLTEKKIQMGSSSIAVEEASAGFSTDGGLTDTGFEVKFE